MTIQNILEEIQFQFMYYYRQVSYFVRNQWHFVRHGFYKDDVFALSEMHARWIVPRLKLFRETMDSHPSYLTMEQWEEIVDRMIKGFEVSYQVVDEDHFTMEHIMQREEVTNHALRLFSKYYQALWN